MAMVTSCGDKTLGEVFATNRGKSESEKTDLNQNQKQIFKCGSLNQPHLSRQLRRAFEQGEVHCSSYTKSSEIT